MQEQERKNALINKNIINNLKQNDTNSKNNNINYLKYLYEIINNEINSILSDINFQAYHDKFINIKDNNININFLEEKLNNALIKMIEFLEELKYDYIQIKNENINILKYKINNNKKITIENNKNNELIEQYKFKMEELLNNNKMLKDQINIINKNNEIKLLKDDEMNMKYENIEKENQNLRFNNDNLINKLDIANENNIILEKENNELKRKIQKIKMAPGEDDNLKQTINDLSMDYQRLLKENQSLKIFLNSQNFSN